MTLASCIKTRPSDCFYAAALCLHLLFWSPCVVSGEKRHFNVEVRQMAFLPPSLPFPAACCRRRRRRSLLHISRFGVRKAVPAHITVCGQWLPYCKNKDALSGPVMVIIIIIIITHTKKIITRASLVCRAQWNRRMFISVSSSADAHRCRNMHPWSDYTDGDFSVFIAQFNSVSFFVSFFAWTARYSLYLRCRPTWGIALLAAGD